MKEIEMLVIDIMNDTLYRKNVSPKNFMEYQKGIHDKGVTAIEQYVIKAKIEVAGKAPYLVIDGEVVSTFKYIAELKKGLK